ncbi:hypothetical protein Holit_01070 [Hollandina sp. SP2]
MMTCGNTRGYTISTGTALPFVPLTNTAFMSLQQKIPPDIHYCITPAGYGTGVLHTACTSYQYRFKGPSSIHSSTYSSVIRSLYSYSYSLALKSPRRLSPVRSISINNLRASLPLTIKASPSELMRYEHLPYCSGRQIHRASIHWTGSRTRSVLADFSPT